MSRFMAVPVMRCDTPRCGRAFIALAAGYCDRCTRARAEQAEAAREAQRENHMRWSADRSERAP